MKESYDDKKETIKKAGLQVFSKYGYYKTTLDDIADTVGIKKNSLYYYFPSKESLFEEIVRSEVVKMKQCVQKSVDSVDDYEEKVIIFFKELFYYGRKRGHPVSISLETLVEIGQVIEEYFFEIFKQVTEMLADILSKGYKEGKFIKHNSYEVASLLAEFITSFEREQVRKNKIKSADALNLEIVEQKVVGIVSLVIKGLVKEK